jgi:Na+/citrate or Na+/malate symporter
MLPELKLIAKWTVATAIFGAVIGILIGALAEDFILWVLLMTVAGGGFGMALSYGFLPES